MSNYKKLVYVIQTVNSDGKFQESWEKPSNFNLIQHTFSGLGHFVLSCAVPTISVKSKAPYLENKTTKDILHRHSDNCSKALQSEDSGLV